MKVLKNNRVELHPATDQWMSGDRFGSIQARRRDGSLLIRLDKSQKLLWVDKKNILREFAVI